MQAIKRTFITFFLLITSLFTLIDATYAAQSSSAYKNVFISYYAPENVSAIVKYAKQKKLGGLIMWELKNDLAYNDKNSLLTTAVKAYKPNISFTPTIMTYWTNWSTHNNPPYAIPNSLDAQNTSVTNKDFTDKLTDINILAYAFIGAQMKTYHYGGKILKNPHPDQIGTLFFTRPAVDLLPPSQDSFCKNKNPICWHGATIKNKSLNETAKMGNFETFAKLHRHNKNNPLGKLKKVISIGGAGGVKFFEQTFASPPYINNFATSASKIINHYNLDGIDLDYENPNMTRQNSDNYLKLIKALRHKLGNKKLITVTIMSNPKYILGTKDNNIHGFNPKTNVLKKIAKLVDKINLMTYDFHGAFDYDPNISRTGFLTNLYMPTDAPADYDAKFSINRAVLALEKTGVPARKITIGFPAYGRALANIPNKNKGLFQIIPSTTHIPKGNLTTKKTCNPNISSHLTYRSCSGTFQYKYIINHLLKEGFKQTIWHDAPNNISNGVTAYAVHWALLQKMDL